MEKKRDELPLRVENKGHVGVGFILSDRYAFEETSAGKNKEDEKEPETPFEAKPENESQILIFPSIKKRMFGRIPEPGSPEKYRFDTALCSFAALVCGLVFIAGSLGAGTLPDKPKLMSDVLAVLSASSLCLSAGLFLKYRLLTRRKRRIFDSVSFRNSVRNEEHNPT